MKKAYIKLYAEGYAHSIETYYENELVGGLYQGLSLGKAFFGESMFHTKTDASKVALYYGRTYETMGIQFYRFTGQN